MCEDKYAGFQWNWIVLLRVRDILTKYFMIIKMHFFLVQSVNEWAWVCELVTTITIRFNKLPKYDIIYFWLWLCLWMMVFFFFTNCICSKLSCLLQLFPYWLHEWSDLIRLISNIYSKKRLIYILLASFCILFVLVLLASNILNEHNESNFSLHFTFHSNRRKVLNR